MLIQRRTISLTIAAALWTAACGDDDGTEMNNEQDGSAEAGTGGDAGPDGGQDIDATPGADADIDGNMVAPDGNVITPDGNVVTPDGSVITPDGSVLTPDGGDAGPQGMDAAVGDGGTDATAPDGGPCDVMNAQFGCGTNRGTTWITFSSGIEVDRTNNVAWTQPMTVVDDDALASVCSTLNVGGLTGWELPQMQDVRKLAAGCPETVPGGSCQVNVNRVGRPEAGDCTCDTGLTGPNNGKFCRADIPSCDVLWVWTHTWENPDYEHWFYDVNTGSIVPAIVGQGIAVEAKGRCMHPLAPNTIP